MNDAESILREYVSAVGAGDRERLTAVLKEDVKYHFPGRSPLAGLYEGRDEVLAYIYRLRDLTQGTVRVAVRDLFAGADGGAVVIRAEAERDGHAFGWNIVALMHCDQAGIDDIRLYYDDQYGIDAFLGDR